MRIILIVFLLCFTSINISAQKKQKHTFRKLDRKVTSFFREHSSKKSKAVIAALDISMGFLGVHRLYLGTSPKVPVVYAVTLGGGGFLVLSDLIISLSAKDLEKYSNNDHILLWNTEK